MKKISIQTDKAPAAIGPYSQAVRAGNLLFVSGQIPIDPATGSIVTSGIEAETHQVMKNIHAILNAAGLNFSHIVKSTLFIRDMGDFALINAVYGSYFDADGYPARETVEVSCLPKNARIEITVTAMFE